MTLTFCKDMADEYLLYPRMIAKLQDAECSDLSIRRFGSDCYLIVVVDGVPHVFTDSKGKRKVYRHVWQIREWLESTYGIQRDSVPVELMD